MSGCSSIFDKQERKTFQSFSQAWSEICLSGNGKGRIKYLKESYSFGHEMAIRQNLSEWIVGMNFPIHGEEVLLVAFKDIESHGAVVLKGSFVERLRKSLRESKRGDEIVVIVEGMFYDLAMFLNAYNSTLLTNKQYSIVEKDGAHGEVLYDRRKVFDWSIESNGSFHIIVKNKSKYDVEIVFYKGDKFSDRIDVVMKTQGQFDTEKPDIELNLAIINCITGH